MALITSDCDATHSSSTNRPQSPRIARPSDAGGDGVPAQPFPCDRRQPRQPPHGKTTTAAAPQGKAGFLVLKPCLSGRGAAGHGAAGPTQVPGTRPDQLVRHQPAARYRGLSTPCVLGGREREAKCGGKRVDFLLTWRQAASLVQQRSGFTPKRPAAPNAPVDSVHPAQALETRRHHLPKSLRRRAAPRRAAGQRGPAERRGLPIYNRASKPSGHLLLRVLNLLEVVHRLHLELRRRGLVADHLQPKRHSNAAVTQARTGEGERDCLCLALLLLFYQRLMPLPCASAVILSTTDAFALRVCCHSIND